MEIKDYPSASEARERTHEPKRKPVVESTEVTTRKHSGVSRVKDKILQEDLPKVKNHIIFDVFIPAIKQLIDDSVHMLLFGETRARSRESTNPSEKINYRRYYPEPDARDTRYSRRRERRDRTILMENRNRRYDDLLFPTRHKARRVLRDMIAVMENEGQVSISDMYDFAEMDCSYTYEYYGWIINTDSDIRDSEILHIVYDDEDKFYINLPPAVELPDDKRR